MKRLTDQLCIKFENVQPNDNHSLNKQSSKCTKHRKKSAKLRAMIRKQDPSSSSTTLITTTRSYKTGLAGQILKNVRFCTSLP